jgi:hypothetical protein
MKLSGSEFINSPHKAITLLGMSGVGKTHFSGLLKRSGWRRYSCDYQIGNKYLATHLNRTMSDTQDISVLSAFIGKPGNPAKGGITYEEFKKRQILYYEAECAALEEALKAIPPNGHFVHDSTGSLCEIMNEVLLEKLGQKTLFVYLKAGKKEEDTVLERALQTPKPLFHPPFQLESWIGHYLEEMGLKAPDEMTPDDFARWVFPKLFHSRLPKYQKLADLYGVTIPCENIYNIDNTELFIKKIAEALDG